MSWPWKRLISYLTTYTCGCVFRYASYTLLPCASVASWGNQENSAKASGLSRWLGVSISNFKQFHSDFRGKVWPSQQPETVTVHGTVLYLRGQAERPFLGTGLYSKSKRKKACKCTRAPRLSFCSLTLSPSHPPPNLNPPSNDGAPQ